MSRTCERCRFHKTNKFCSDKPDETKACEHWQVFCGLPRDQILYDNKTTIFTKGDHYDIYINTEPTVTFPGVITFTVGKKVVAKVDATYDLKNVPDHLHSFALQFLQRQGARVALPRDWI